MVIDAGPDLEAGGVLAARSYKSGVKARKRAHDVRAKASTADAAIDRTSPSDLRKAKRKKTQKETKRKTEDDHEQQIAAAEPASSKPPSKQQMGTLRAQKRSKEEGAEETARNTKSKRRKAAVPDELLQPESRQAAEKQRRKDREVALEDGGGKPSPPSEIMDNATPGSRKRKQKASNVVELSPEEAKRRQRQRELRDLALKQRAEGKPYQRPKDKPLAKRPTAEKADRSGPNRKRPRFAVEDEPGSRPSHPVEVIVVPIYWQSHPGEKAAVMDIAQQAVACLEGAAVKTGMDRSEAYTPGQKFGFWEEKGVMVRIECGPKDAAKQQCMLALSKTAGHVAPKRAYKIGTGLLRAVGEALGRRLDAGGEEIEPEEVLVQTSGSKDVIKEAPKVAKSAQIVLGSGDDLGDDFELPPANEPSKKQKKTKKKHLLD